MPHLMGASNVLLMAC